MGAPRPAMETSEPKVRFFSPMPVGYNFVPKGDVYITKHCRAKTRDAGQTVYVVVDKLKKPLGLRCPQHIIDQVTAAHQATAAARAEAVQKKDSAVEDEFRNEVIRIFPDVPRAELPAILEQALQKRSGRVGRTGTLTLEGKVKFAVIAHIRHCHTDYDKLLRGGMAREEARKKIAATVSMTSHAWGNQRNANATSNPKQRQKPGDAEINVVPRKAGTTAPIARAEKAPQLVAETPAAGRVNRRRSAVIHARQAQIIVINDSDDDDKGAAKEGDVAVKPDGGQMPRKTGRLRKHRRRSTLMHNTKALRAPERTSLRLRGIAADAVRLEDSEDDSITKVSGGEDYKDDLDSFIDVVNEDSDEDLWT